MALSDYATKLAIAQQNDIKRQEYWNDRLLEIIKLETSNFVFSNLGRSVTIPRNQGTTTLALRRYNSLPVRNLTGAAPTAGNLADERLVEGLANKPLQVEAQRVEVSVDQYGAWIEITDHVKDIHMDDIKGIYQPELARHAAEVRERAIIDKFSEASEYFVGGVATEAAELTDTDVLTMKELRKVALSMKIHRRKGHTSFGGKPVAVLHPSVMEDLLDDEDLKNRLLTPGQENAPIKMGTLQSYMFYGMYVIETLIAEEQLIEDTEGDFGVYTSYFLGYEPYAVSSLGNGSVEWKMTGFEATKDDPLGQRATFGYRMWGGAKVLDPIAITKIYSRSAYDLNASPIHTGDDPIGATATQAE
jgi:N4-gp56 family major capsid protein